MPDRLETNRRHVHEFHVRFGDIDVLGHVNNCRYLTYLEDARISMFRLDLIREGREPLKGLVVARHEIDYKRPLLFGPDPVRVETWRTRCVTTSASTPGLRRSSSRTTSTRPAPAVSARTKSPSSRRTSKAST
jgi:hypothetical protein